MFKKKSQQYDLTKGFNNGGELKMPVKKNSTISHPGFKAYTKNNVDSPNENNNNIIGTGRSTTDDHKNTDGDFELTEEQQDIDKALEFRHHKKFKVLRFRDEAYLFASTTEMHSFAFILRAGNIFARIIWVLILLAGLGALTWHMNRLFKKYTLYEKSTSIAIKYHSLDFPSITVCNKNPLRKSMLKDNPKVPKAFMDFIEKVLSSSNYTSDFESNTNMENVNRTLIKRRKKRDNVDLSRRFTVKSTNSNTNTNTNHIPYVNPIVINDNESDLFFNNIHDFYDSDFFFTFTGNMSKEMRKEILYSISLRLLNTDLRYELGHQANNFIIDCSFNGRQCSSQDFTQHLSRNYGNCYTFNDFHGVKTPYKVMSSGSLYALNVILHLETSDYREGLQNGEGAVLSIHEHGTRSEIDTNSLSLHPGTDTLIGLNLIEYATISTPKSPCIVEKNYKRLYYAYTQNTCNNICTDQIIAAYCQCMRSEHYENYDFRQLKTLRVCQSVNGRLLIDDDVCESSVVREFRDGIVNCSCHSECEAAAYDIRMSANRYWSIGKWYDLINTVCRVDEKWCAYYKAMGAAAGGGGRKEDDERKRRESLLKDNFVNLRIYYRDLNYQFNKERLTYDTSQLLADVGGSLGLFVGASCITIVEIFDFILGVLQWLVYLFKKSNMHRSKSA